MANMSYAEWRKQKQNEPRNAKGQTYQEWRAQKQQEQAADEYVATVIPQSADYLNATNDISRMAREAQAKASANPLMDLAREMAEERAGVSTVAPGTPGGGGRGYSTVADLDPKTATPGDYMAAIARDQYRAYVEAVTPDNTNLERQRRETNRAFRTANAFMPLENQPLEAWDTYNKLYDEAVEEDRKLKEMGGRAARELPVTLPKSFAAGTLGAVRGLVNEAGYIAQGATKAQMDENAEMWRRMGREDYAQDMEAAKDAQGGFQNWANFGQNYISSAAEAAAGYGKTGQALSNVAQGVGGMVPSIVSNLFVPGSGLPVMFFQASGNATEEAKAAGASDEAAAVYGTAVGAVEVLTEKMFGGIPGLNIGALDDALEAVVKRSVGSEAAQRAILFLIDALGEGVEEFTSEFGDYFLDKWLLKNDDRTIDEVGKDAMYSFLIGALTSIAMQAPVEVANMAKTSQGRKQLAQIVADQVDQQMTAEQTQPAVQQTEMPPATEQQPAQPITQKLLRSIAEDPEQLAALGIDTKGKSNSQIREEIRAALENQNAQQRQAKTDMVRSFAETERAAERMTDIGAQTFVDFYDDAQDPEAYIREMSAVYNAGKNGKDAGSVSTPTLSSIQRDAAYLSGQAAQRKADAAKPGIDAVRQYSESEQTAGRMSENGAQIMRSYYDGTQNADDYIRAMTDAYNAGIEGKDVRSLASPVLTRTQRDAAYMAGRAAARQGQTVLAQANIPAEQQTAPVQPTTAQPAPQQSPQSAPAQRTVQQTKAEQPTGQTQKKPAVRAAKPGLVMDETAKKARLTRAETRAINALGKITGTEIRFVDSIFDDEGRKSGGQGVYKNGVVQISVNAKDPYLTVAVHEIVHRIEDLSPEDYNRLRTAVEHGMGDEMQKAEFLRSLGYPEGTDLTAEVVADAFGVMLGNEQYLNRLVQDDRNIVQKFLDELHDMLVEVRRVLTNSEKRLDAEQRAEFEALEKKLVAMESLFEEALKNAGEAYETNGGKPAPAEVSSDFAEAKYSVAPPYRPNSAALENWVKEMSDEASETYSLFNDVNQIGGDVSRRFMLPSEWNEKVRTDKAFAETARKIAERVPENIRKNAHINEDGTITETAFEKEFRMERSMMQRLVDSLPMETIPSTVESNGKRIRISEKGKVNTVGGEAYRRALLDERRKMYREGRLPTKSISGLSKDTWGAMGFLATNGKTGASGDFTTLCPQMYYNKGCFYCYRRAALTTGVNNKLVGENVWYTGEVLQLKQGDIDNLNKNGGLRIQSFGDWMEQYSSQLADLLMDAEEVGLQVKIITKEPSLIDTVALLRNQGVGKNLYFNLSTDYTIEEQGAINNQSSDGAQPRNPFRPYMKQDGKTFWKRALTVEEANEYRKKYPWVNTRIVATTVDEFLEGLRSPMVDVVTGYHGNIRQFERVSSATGETLLQVEALGDAGMPRFAFNQKTGQWTLEYEGKTATHKKLARAIEDAGLQMQYYIKSCCITGRCATCEGKCGKVARDFNVKNATNADKQSVAYWQKHMTSAEDNPLLLEQMEDAQAEALLDAELDRGKYSKSTKELLEAYAEQYGPIKTGEKPVRDITMPKRTTDKTKVSMTARTVAEAGATPESFVATIENLAANHVFDYTPYSDEAAISNAAQIAARKGWSRTLTDWSKEVSSGGVSKTNTAVGWALYNNAVNSGDTETALNVLNLIVKHQRNAAQAVQATRILKQLNPETQLYNAVNVVADINEELKKRLGKKAPEVEIDPDLAEQFLRAKTQDERDKVMTKIFQDIGRKMPTTFLDRWTAWRYTAMLGNVRTIARNTFGNLGFAPVVLAKDLTATALEGIVSKATGGKIGRTKGNVIGRGDLLSAAWDDYANVQEEAMGQSKYSDRQAANKEIEDARRIFGNTKSKVWNKTGGAALEWWRVKTGQAMDATDVIFNKPQYVLAMAQYCAANGISAEQIRSGKGLDAARNYAVREAQKATYRDTNDFSQMVSSLGKSWLHSENAWKRGIATLGEGVLPFRKTPANILARGVEYSPIGLIKSLSYDAVQVKNGNMSAADMIDDISAGLTGTGLLALGVYLAAQGLLRGRGRGDDKKKEFADLEGHQDYALEIGGTSYTLDWLAPEALPLFIGANLWEAAADRKDGMQMKDILTAISNVSEPMLQMSMLQSLNDLLDGNTYGNEETSALMRKLSSAATSYLTQAFPTLLGQVERTGEGKRMTTYTDKNGFLTGDMQYILGKISAKVPIFDYHQIPYIDAWGREELTGEPLGRFFNNFFNPSYVSKVNESGMEQELVRLYDATGENVFPQRAAKYFNVDGERKDLTADEYVKYATTKGQTAYALVGNIVDSAAYKAADDDQKAQYIEDAYHYADYTARNALFGAKIPDSYKWVQKAQNGQKLYRISPDVYMNAMYQCKDVESLKDKDGKTITNSESLQKMEAIYSIPGLNDNQRKYLFECFGVGKTVIGLNKSAVEEKLKGMQKQSKK